MKFFFSKLLLLLLVLGCNDFNAEAQDFRFIYLQHEGFQSFYVKMDGKQVQASKAGYMIIPRLTEKSYNLIIGFAGNPNHEYKWHVQVDSNNTGFLIKNTIDQSLQMVNLVSLDEMTLPLVSHGREAVTYITSPDEFARILSSVVQDSMIGKIAVTQTNKVVANEQPSGRIQIPFNEIKADSSKSQMELVTAKSVIKAIKRDSSFDEIQITYIDQGIKNSDTIHVLIPVTTPVQKGIDSVASKILVQAEKKLQPVQEDKTKFINMELQHPGTRTDSSSVKQVDLVLTQTKKELAENKAPVQFDTSGIVTKDSMTLILDKWDTASHADFLELRKKMAAEQTDTAMYKIALHVFRSTHFTTEQIKNLGVLFLGEAEKYHFFLLAFPYVVDGHHYKGLENQFTDNVYSTRFREIFSQ